MWELSISQNKAVLRLVKMRVENVYENAKHRPGSSKRSGDNSPSHEKPGSRSGNGVCMDRRYPAGIASD
jgi:hypothetical protein